jgi:chlorinating enzyme
MGKILSAREIRDYDEKGYHFPLRAMTPEDAAALRAKVEAFEAEQADGLKGPRVQKLHLLLTWMNDVIRHPRILDAVEDVLGPDILCWQTSFFVKEPDSQGYVSWHQDATYWGLSAPDVCTAWLALSPATVESGAMKVAPGTHKLPQMPHEDTFNPDNLLTRGQELKADIDADSVVDMVLAPGEVSLHHIMLAHASEPNRSNDRRMGLAIRYVAPHVRQTTGVPDSAMLVRGEDRFGHFEAEPPPVADMHPDAVALHGRIVDARQGFIYRGTEKGAHR